LFIIFEFYLKLLEIDQAVDLKRKLLQLERKKEKEIEKRVFFS
jgi:hypothetical protein